MRQPHDQADADRLKVIDEALTRIDSTPPRPVDLDRAASSLEAEITETLRGTPSEIYAPKRKPEPMPDYVEPRPDVPPVGALSAEALVKDYEKTAKQIEAMAAELAASSKRCFDEMLDLTNKYMTMANEIERVVEHVKDTAASYRDEAKTVFVRIEDTTLMMQEVRRLSEDMRGRVSGKSSSINTSDRIPTVTFDT
jgi:hypothetical protein